MRRLVLISLLFSGALHGQSLKSYQEKIPNTTVSFDLVAIPAGNFMLGSSEKQAGHQADEGPQKRCMSMHFGWETSDLR